MHESNDLERSASVDPEADTQIQVDKSVEPAPAGERRPRDAEYWARRSAFLTLSQRELPGDALNLNVEGRQLAGPFQGFGQMWQKTYRAPLRHIGVTPEDVIATWKQNFTRFWPQGNRFFAPLTGIKPGEVGLINSAMPGGTRLSTGVMVLYADDESFTLMTPQGHVFAGWITFSAWQEPDEDDAVSIQVQLQIRASDPAFELGLLFGGHKVEDTFWTQTLKNVAAHFDRYPYVDVDLQLLDPSRQWSRATNIFHNAFIRSVLYDISRPARWVGRRVLARQ
jgi:hypothetical protein